MELIKIEPDKLKLNPVDIWLNQWFLLTSGDLNKYNTMTVAWGSIGVMWNLPMVQVVVRPTRYTFEFMEKYSSFSLCGFPRQYKPDLSLLGSKSGRDGDKIAETNLTICKSDKIEAPCFKQAELIMECRKIYCQRMDPQKFTDPEIEKNYPQKDYHQIYFGEIVQIRADKFKFSGE
ncbi:MAG: hypothetical protein APR63_14740 [Desulfuromonas sp. SDB]|nr:MAG: hypothetical protein APR63_14740 [Desulfuromonas sp. SDB]